MDSKQSLDRGNCCRAFLIPSFLVVLIFCIFRYDVLQAKDEAPEDFIGPLPGTILYYKSDDGFESVVEIQKGSKKNELILVEELYPPDWAVKVGAPASIKSVYSRGCDDCRIYQSSGSGESVGIDFCQDEWLIPGDTPEQGRVMWPCSIIRRGVELLFGEQRRTLTVSCRVTPEHSLDFVWAEGIGLLRYNGLEVVEMKTVPQ